MKSSMKLFALKGVVAELHQIKKLVASDGFENDQFSCNVSISGDISFNDYKGYSSGSAYSFERNQGGNQGYGEILKLSK